MKKTDLEGQNKISLKQLFNLYPFWLTGRFHWPKPISFLSLFQIPFSPADTINISLWPGSSVVGSWSEDMLNMSIIVLTLHGIERSESESEKMIAQLKWNIFSVYLLFFVFLSMLSCIGKCAKHRAEERKGHKEMKWSGFTNTSNHKERQLVVWYTNYMCNKRSPSN